MYLREMCLPVWPYVGSVNEPSVLFMLIRSSVIGNFKNEDIFLEHEGLFLLLDLLEVIVQCGYHTFDVYAD